MSFTVAGLVFGRKLLSQGCQRADNSVLLQFVRFRKRRWAPITKSKIYYVREPTYQDPEEYKQLKKEYNIYRTAVRGIKSYLKNELKSQQVASESTILVEEEEKRFAQCLEENDRWNQQTAKIREARQCQEEAEMEEKKLQEILQAEEEHRRKLELAKQHVLMEKEKARHFITQENLEEEIEKALNMRVNYNFAIDKEGNRYVELPDGTTRVETKESDSVQTFSNTEDLNSEQKSAV